jgi:hypothetical protein
MKSLFLAVGQIEHVRARNRHSLGIERGFSVLAGNGGALVDEGQVTWVEERKCYKNVVLCPILNIDWKKN